MDVTSAFSALRIALTYGPKLSFVVFLHILIVLLRPDIVDKGNRVKRISLKHMFHSYDFIIIGGGSAGSVLANRLAETNRSVLLLEAGGDETVISDVPALTPILQQTNLDWQFKTEPSSKYCLGMNNNQCNWPRGKSLGGSSMHNGMQYIRGNRRDYDHWRDLGNPGWGYDDILPYFKKSENMTIPNLRNSPYHGTRGHLTVEEFRSTSPMGQYFLDAGRDLGYDIVDGNGKCQTGFMYPQGTLRDGLRCSAAKAYLRSASRRKNLYVCTNALVDKILINETTKAAYGVKFRRKGKKYAVYATTEVILSAGTIQSPQILMNSGIGPKNHLAEIGVRVIHHSPGVGQNLQDHVVMGGLKYLIDLPSTSKEATQAESKHSGLVTLSAAKQFLIEHDGPLYGFPIVAALAFVNSIYANSSHDYPDIQLVSTAAADNRNTGFLNKRYLALREDFVTSQDKGLTKKITFDLTPALLRPKSRGYIKLKDSNPNHHPLIIPNYFDDPHDLDVLIEGAKIAYKISQTPTMKKLNVRPNPNLISECAHLSFNTDDYLRCHARYYTYTANHPCCTCKMGPPDDIMAVVDPRLRVYGVKGLRVVDASVMPRIVSGNLNAPTIMIAEKASDLIKKDYNL